MFPVGSILLLLLLVLVACDWMKGTLQVMRLTERHAMYGLASLLLLSGVEFPLAPGLSLNLGSGLLAPLLALSLLLTSERVALPQALWASLVSAVAVLIMGRWFEPGQPTELNLIYLDTQYFYALVGGAAAYLTAESPRAAFAAGVIGPLLAAAVQYGLLVPDAPSHLQISLGGAQQGTTIVSGVLALLLASLQEHAPITNRGRNHHEP